MMTIYTDGSCRRNPNGPGGFAVVVLNNDGDLETTYSENEASTTNNRMEMKAILYALENYGTENKEDAPIVYSDSSYCVNTFTNWMYNWEKNNWIKSDNKIPENLDLVKKYYDLSKTKYINLQKVKGHDGIQYNELADKIAKASYVNI